MEQITYLFDTGMMKREISSDGSQLKTAPLSKKMPSQVSFDEITQVEIKKVSMTGGAQIKIVVCFERDGKRTFFPDSLGIEGLRNDQNIVAYLNELKEKASHAEFIDKTVKQKKTSSEQSHPSLAISVNLFGIGSILPNWFILGLLTLCFSPLIVTIPLGIYAMLRGYRVSFDDNGIEVTKILSKKIAWNEIETVDLVNVNIESMEGYDLGSLIEFKVNTKNGKASHLLMRFDEAKQMEELFRKRNLMRQNYQQVSAI